MPPRFKNRGILAYLRKENFVANGNHMNGLEGLRGCLKRKPAAKGGIRRARSHLYLGEYV